MEFKPFFVHRHHAPGKLPNRAPRGFSALITPNMQDNRYVFMQVSLCSPKDEFNKKQGRSFARAASSEVVNKRDVPRMLASLEYICELSDTINENNWYYIFKYVL